MLRAPRLLAALTACCAAGLVAGCDEAPGPPPLVSAPPAILDLDVDPLDFAYTGAEPVVTIPITLSAAVDEGDGGVTIVYIVRPQFSNAVLAEGTLEPSGDRYVAEDAIEVERGAVGRYVVTVVASGAGGVGNEATALIAYTASDLGPPVVEGVAASPNPVTPPATFTVTADVTDPDGLTNVARVALQSPSGAEFQLCDDGGRGVCGFGGTDFPSPSGDATAGDGRFSRRFSLPEGEEPGEVPFTVQAFDLAGQASDPVPLTVTIQ